MTFISAEYLAFFALVLPLHYALPPRGRIPMLLCASLIFYAWGGPGYTLLLLIAVGVNYAAGLRIARATTQAGRLLPLVGALLITFGILAFFKYFSFLAGTAASLFALGNIHVVPPEWTLSLPIGISFFTFQAFSYTVDVYRRQIDVETNLPSFALFVSFFPQLVAGPIERAGSLLPQMRRLRQRLRFEPDRVVDGLRLILWGFFKKVVIGDTFAAYVNAVYGAPREHVGLPLIVATVLFAFQIYCDFSAYSDIARGTARILGIELMQNFRQPYFSRSMREFWTRWHISLSTWFRDYLYIPLGGNRVKLPRQAVNLLIVFLVSGLWHGADWTFVIWGALHGVMVVGELLMRGQAARAGDRDGRWAAHVAQAFGTFALVCLAWIFFRASSLEDAWYILTHLHQINAVGLSALAGAGGWSALGLLGASGLIGLLLIVDWIDARRGLGVTLDALPTPLRWACYYGVTAAVVVAVTSASAVQQFIYFRF